LGFVVWGVGFKIESLEFGFSIEDVMPVPGPVCLIFAELERARPERLGEREGEREEAPLALRATRPHTVGYVGG